MDIRHWRREVVAIPDYTFDASRARRARRRRAKARGCRARFLDRPRPGHPVAQGVVRWASN